jgi:hypothetical protein
MRLRIPALLFVATAGGCVAETGIGYHAAVVAPAPVVVTPTVEATATVEAAPVEAAPAVEVEVDASPELVEVEPGIQVVYDYNEPVFFNDGFYWRFYNGGWYRSSVHTGGWVVYNDPPARIRGIRNPHTYAHYRPANYTPRARTAPVYNGGRGHVAPAGHTAPVYNGGHAAPAGHTAPVYNGAAGHTAPPPAAGHTAPVYNGGAKAAPPARTPPKKDEKKK